VEGICRERSLVRATTKRTFEWRCVWVGQVARSFEYRTCFEHEHLVLLFGLGYLKSVVMSSHRIYIPEIPHPDQLNANGNLPAWKPQCTTAYILSGLSLPPPRRCRRRPLVLTLRTRGSRRTGNHRGRRFRRSSACNARHCSR
jgi:hypothetical protein